MKKFILILCFCLITSYCFGAELLVKAKSHWLDELSQAEINTLIADNKITLESYNSRTQIGDIIVVRPDGWEWGREETLPIFVLVKIPDMPIEEAKQYEAVLMDNTIPTQPVILKRRKWKISSVYVDTIKQAGGSVITNKTAFLSKVSAKTQ